MMRADTRLDYHSRILRVLRHVHAHLDHALSLSDLARIAHFSPYHFHRVFQGMVGESVTELARRLRLERAAHLLRSGDEPVTRIAFGAGYEAHESFTRAFRTLFGVSPSAFRKVGGAVMFKRVPSNIHYQVGGCIEDFTPRTKGVTAMEVEIKRIAPFRVAYIRHTGPYEKCGPVWERLMAWAGPRNLCGPATRCLGICYDDPACTPPEKIRYDACISVDNKVQPEGEVRVQEIPGGDYAVGLHCGSYDKLKITWKEMYGEWIPASGREPQDTPTFEVYLNCPDDTPADDLRVEIWVPLAPVE